MPATHAMTLRLPGPIYKAARRLARQRGVSLNRFVQDAIADQARRSVEARLRNAYDALSQDELAAREVESALAVQVEAILSD